LKRASGNELCGVIVYSYPPPSSFGRRIVTPKMTMSEMNQKLSSISRVVVHPKYRTIGLGAKLIKETLPLADTEFVEMSAVMGKYNPFAEKAGMKKIVEQEPPKEALGILATLQGLGFNDQLLSSEKCALEKLQTLHDEEIQRIRQAFVKYNHPRFIKAFDYHLPFGAKQIYREQIEHLNLEKLVHLSRSAVFLCRPRFIF
jgi:GNAT superfamily N-acetyltransferase